MSKHTPGPWFYDSGAIWSDSQLDPENKPYVFRGEEPLAAVISRNAQDAHLIAAAPQMLEALELLSEAVRSLDEQISTVHNKIIITDAVSLLRLQNAALSAANQAEAAIAAAKGGEV